MKDAAAIIKWQYWLYNHGNPKEILVELYGENLGNHFYHKFAAKCELFRENTVMAWVDLFMDMTTDNQTKLIEYVLENYDKATF